MVEQGTAAKEITTAVASMRQQSEQAARALVEQARAMKDVSAATSNTAKQVKLIQRANREHSTVSEDLLARLADIKRITERNAAGVHEARGSAADLLGQAAALRTSVTKGRTVKPRGRANGR
jgi:methyl-accepting chemotaxis protein